MKVLDVDCPKCGSRQTMLCLNPKANEELDMPTRFHRERIRLAEELTVEQNGEGIDA